MRQPTKTSTLGDTIKVTTSPNVVEDSRESKARRRFDSAALDVGDVKSNAGRRSLPKTS